MANDKYYPNKRTGFFELQTPPGFDKTLTPGQLTPTDPLTDPLLTPYKINGKMKIKKPRTINGTRFKFINKFSLPETSKMAVALQISDSPLI